MLKVCRWRFLSFLALLTWLRNSNLFYFGSFTEIDVMSEERPELSRKWRISRKLFSALDNAKCVDGGYLCCLNCFKRSNGGNVSEKSQEKKNNLSKMLIRLESQKLIIVKQKNISSPCERLPTSTPHFHFENYCFSFYIQKRHFKNL